MLRTAYNSLLLQIVGSLLLFSLAKVNGRNQELLLNAAVALFLTTLLATALPALGPWVHFGYGALNSADTAYVAHVLALRQGNPPPFALSQMQGIDCFPSFHTVLAVLLVYAHRGIRWSFLPIAALNAVMLFSIPSEGGHYLSDMIGSAAVALLAITLVHAALRLTMPARMLHPPRSVPV
ncbi:MAG: phosphatase PAP2 family protein [Pseudomonadota bacterium]|nr:phosphatase PAP2 family protein [Pseudomonadota bacterium]